MCEGTPSGRGVQVRRYGVTDGGREIRAFTLANASGIRAEILEYGGILASLWVPDAAGRVANVVLGRSSLAGYERKHPYLGALVGRYTNRIRQATFSLDGVSHKLSANQGAHHLHGGTRGFDARTWRGDVASEDEPAVSLRLTSPAGEEGYPGELQVEATYRLTDANALRVEFRAVTDAPTIVSLTNHSYFNLAGEGAGTVCGHRLTVDADAFTAVDGDLLPTGEIATVDGTPFDLRAGRAIGDVVRADHPQIAFVHGVDHNYVLRGSRSGGRGQADELRRAAQLVDPRSGRTLEVHTVEPGLQVYTGNFLDGSLVGTGGRRYRQGDGIALETQCFPDAPNIAAFPDPTLRPGETYRSVTEFRFGVERAG